MPTVDVAVIGAGLSGLVTAVRLAGEGARVVIIAQGNGATHWSGGPLDLGFAPGARDPAAAVRVLGSRAGHPYTYLGADLPAAVVWLVELLRDAGLAYVGSLDQPFGRLPTGAGATRPVALVPDGQAAALEPWRTGEDLVIVGPAGFKDLWPDAVASSLGRRAVWGGSRAPSTVRGLTVDLPSIGGRRNLSALTLAQLFDDPGWRSTALDAIARGVDTVARGEARIGLPAVLGLDDHASVLRDAADRLGRPVIELPLVPPGIPGLRLYRALRAALIARGGRLLLGEPVLRVERQQRRVQALVTAAAAREQVVRVGATVLATGGLTGGGVVGDPDGRLRETVFGLPVDGPAIDDWLTGDSLQPGSQPIELAGLRTDVELRPVEPSQAGARPIYDNVRIVGSALAGQRFLLERCGDGVAVASAWRAAGSLLAGDGGASRGVKGSRTSSGRPARACRSRTPAAGATSTPRGSVS
jgi:glycerol-3-phosphate dehydrogenase subunit B